MRNVLEKSGHKKNYYTRRRFIKYSAAAFAIFLIAAIPVGISYRISLLESQDNTSTKQEGNQFEDEGSDIAEYEEE